MTLKALYMFVSPGADSTKHRAIIDTPGCHMLVVSVDNIEEGAKIAKQLVQEGIALIELCGGFGYEGAKKVSDEVGDKVPVGMVGYQVLDAARLAKILELEMEVERKWRK